MRAAIVVFLLIALAACARNPYRVFYRGMPTVIDQPSYMAEPGSPRVYGSSDLAGDVKALTRKGYFPVGAAAFSGPPGAVNDRHAVNRALELGAHIVLVRSRYTHTETGVAAVAVPVSSTSRTTGTASVYGSGGYAYGQGESRTVTRGTETAIVPYANARHDYEAVFLAKQYQRVGLVLREPADDERRAWGTNAGMVTDVVIDETPAQRADVFVGDVLLSVDGRPIYSADQYKGILDASMGREAVFEFKRDGASITKTIPVLPYPAKPAK